MFFSIFSFQGRDLDSQERYGPPWKAAGYVARSEEVDLNQGISLPANTSTARVDFAAIKTRMCQAGVSFIFLRFAYCSCNTYSGMVKQLRSARAAGSSAGEACTSAAMAATANEERAMSLILSLKHLKYFIILD